MTKNPSYITSRIGVIVPGDSDWGEKYVLVAEGAFTVANAAADESCDIVSCKIDELTEISPSIAERLIRKSRVE